jgi:hypothetical protein
VINLEVEDFTGPRAALNHPCRALPVTVADVANKAVTVGGVSRAGTDLQKTLRRGSIVALVEACVTVRPSDGALVTTELYDAMETTEKTAASFRLGMALAAVVAERVLGIDQLNHVSWRAGGPGRRADLYGHDRGND